MCIRDRLLDATISRLAPAPAKRNHILLPAQGGVMAQMRRIFYWRTKLAILLIDRPVATMLPQAAHRQATLAARCDKRPSRWIRRPEQRTQTSRAAAPAAVARARRRRDGQRDPPISASSIAATAAGVARSRDGRSSTRFARQAWRMMTPGARPSADITSSRPARRNISPRPDARGSGSSSATGSRA